MNFTNSYRNVLNASLQATQEAVENHMGFFAAALHKHLMTLRAVAAQGKLFACQLSGSILLVMFLVLLALPASWQHAYAMLTIGSGVLGLFIQLVVVRQHYAKYTPVWFQVMSAGGCLVAIAMVLPWL